MTKKPFWYNKSSGGTLPNYSDLLELGALLAETGESSFDALRAIALTLAARELRECGVAGVPLASTTSRAENLGLEFGRGYAD